MTDYEKLKKLYDEIDALIAQGVTSSDQAFLEWKSVAQLLLQKHYGETSFKYKLFENISFKFTGAYVVNPSARQLFIDACRKGLGVAKRTLGEYLEEMSASIETESDDETIKDANTDYFNSIFIVHGHNGELKLDIARVIEKQKDIDAIILHEKVNQGATIIEKFEKYSDVGAAIILFTADDIGCAKSESATNPRARQNVVFEAGFFIGKLGRSKVILIAEKGVELPSDLQGVVYTSKDDWRLDVLSELEAIGFAIDYSKLKKT